MGATMTPETRDAGTCSSSGRARRVPRPAYWLAEAGHRVLVVEKKHFPREKTCGDGLTPRAVRQLHDMGLAEPALELLRYDGLRSIAHGVTLELRVARAPRLPRPTATSCAGAISTRWWPTGR